MTITAKYYRTRSICLCELSMLSKPFNLNFPPLSAAADFSGRGIISC